jgi:hypothetical protein
MSDDRQITLRVPAWFYRAVILAILAGVIAVGKWWYHELRGDIDAKADRAATEERRAADREKMAELEKRIEWLERADRRRNAR